MNNKQNFIRSDGLQGTTLTISAFSLYIRSQSVMSGPLTKSEKSDDSFHIAE